MSGTNGKKERSGFTADREISSLTLQEMMGILRCCSMRFPIWKRLLLRFLVGSWRWFSMISSCFKAIIRSVLTGVLLCLIIGIMSPILITMIFGYVLLFVLCAILNF